MHTHTDVPHRINFKKPGAPACGWHAPGLIKNRWKLLKKREPRFINALMEVALCLNRTQTFIAYANVYINNDKHCGELRSKRREA